MSKKHDHNPHLIHDVTEVLVVQSKTLPPRTFVIATGENRSHAANPRLRRSAEPHVPELLLLDFEVDHGAAAVLTGAQVVLEIEPNGGQREVMVQAKTNSITVGLPEAAPQAATLAVADYSTDGATIQRNGTPDPLVVATFSTFTIKNTSANRVDVTLTDSKGNAAGPTFTLSGNTADPQTFHTGKVAGDDGYLKVSTSTAALSYYTIVVDADAGGDFVLPPFPVTPSTPELGYLANDTCDLKNRTSAQKTLYIYEIISPDTYRRSTALFGVDSYTFSAQGLWQPTIQTTAANKSFLLSTSLSPSPSAGSKDGKLNVGTKPTPDEDE
jgi:hypothetical protein